MQTKPRVSQPGDMYEQEADRVAEAVMKNTERPSLSDHSAVPHIQRMCSQCEEEQDESLDDEDIKAASPDENQSLETPQETETQDTETQNAEAQDAQTNVDNQSPAEPVTDETTPITNGTTQIGDERTPEESPTETTTASLIAEDSTGELQAGQMRRAAFLSQLRTAVTATAEDALAGTGRTARDCPYIQYWFGYYSNQDATYIDRAMKRYAPETSGATTAEEAISMLAARVRRAVGVWATSGEITGVPEGV
ncbi:MAG TPA: hypothetical protein VF507_01545, partial [Pyrinomonadaceae bacterium]